MTLKRLIIYDLDGTLVDTRKDICLAANHMVTALGGAELSQSEIESHVGRGLKHLIRGCLKSDDEKRLEKGSKIYREYYAAHMMDHTALYPGAAEALKYFSGRFQAVLTNKPDPFSRKILEELGVARYFFAIIPGNGKYPPKPDPASILSMMREKKISEDECLMVGDSEIDIETARNAGIEAAVISHGFMRRDVLESLSPELLFRDLREFLSAAKEKKW